MSVSSTHLFWTSFIAIKSAPGPYQARSGRMSKRVQFGDRGTAAASVERGDNGPWDWDKNIVHTAKSSGMTDAFQPLPPSTPGVPTGEGWGVDVWAHIYACTSHSNSLKWIWGSPPVLWDSSPCTLISASSMKDCINRQTAQAPSLLGGGGGLQGFPPPRWRLNNRSVLVLICRHWRLQQWYWHKGVVGKRGVERLQRPKKRCKLKAYWCNQITVKRKATKMASHS